MKVDPETGFLQAVYVSGFTAKKKAAFIERYKVCRNFAEVCKSVSLDLQTVYDAIALDAKFRDAVNACKQIPGRKMRLNDALENIKTEEHSLVIQQLAKAADKYKK